MKKFSSKTISTVIGCVTLGLASGFAVAQEHPQTNMVVAGNLSGTTQSNELETPFWNQIIPERSNGAINVRFRPWDQMGLDGSEVIRLVRQGTLQAGTTVMGFNSGDLPMVDGTDLAGLSPDVDTLRSVTDAFSDELKSYYEDEAGVKVLGLWSYQAQVLYCNFPINSLEDLNGKRVRVGSASQSDFIEHFGGAGVSMAWGEVQQALQLGVLDCGVTGSVGGYTGNWHEAASHLHPLPLSWSASVMVVNPEFWNGLPVHTQEMIQTEVDALADRIWQQNQEENEWGVACNADGPCPIGDPAGMTISDVTDREIQLRTEALNETVLRAWADRCGADCVEKWNASVGDAIGLEI